MITRDPRYALATRSVTFFFSNDFDLLVETPPGDRILVLEPAGDRILVLAPATDVSNYEGNTL